MDNFNEIREQWEQQEIPAPRDTEYQEIIKNHAYLLKKQRIGQVVLGITVAILVLFFFYISAYRNSTLFWGLAIMALSLVVRICIEAFSIIKKKTLHIEEAMLQYNQELIRYYKTRKAIHFIATPILFIIYICGFLMLLPTFEQELSQGFYTYIFYSSWISFIGLAVLITVQIKKELEILKLLTTAKKP